MISDFQFGSSPETLALTILVSTFFLEDIAIGYAGFLAATGVLAPWLAFLALFLGVYMGDIGLYFLGVSAKYSPRVRRIIGEERIQRAGKWLECRSIITLIGARMMPGSRLPIYAASGFLDLSFATFAGTTAATSLAWTATLFTAIYAFGIGSADLFGSLQIGAAILAALLLIGSLLLYGRRIARRTNTAHA